MSATVPESINTTGRNVSPDFVLRRQGVQLNPATTIRYALPHRSRVNLSVYDLLGQEVGQLVNREIGAGYHSVDFDASRLASPVYIYKFTSALYRPAAAGI